MTKVKEAAASVDAPEVSDALKRRRRDNANSAAARIRERRKNRRPKKSTTNGNELQIKYGAPTAWAGPKRLMLAPKSNRYTEAKKTSIPIASGRSLDRSNMWRAAPTNEPKKR
jgi:hypothetical protein